MFGNCCSLTSLDLSDFNTSNVKNMSHMFDNCFSLINIKIPQLIIMLFQMVQKLKDFSHVNILKLDIAKFREKLN